jgi:uncharacterized membrane protein
MSAITNKQAYLAALKSALAGLPPEAAARTMAYYEQRFVDGEAAGRGEAEIAAGLDEPSKIALTLRASTHLHAFEQKQNPANLARMLVSAGGLLIFNLFMVVPALVYSALLLTLFGVSLGMYIGGIAITASGLAGANELVLDGPLRALVSEWDGDANPGSETRIIIADDGINIVKDAHPARDSDGATAAPSNSSDDNDANDANDAGGTDDSGDVIRKAEALASHGLHISTGSDYGSRTTQALFGLGMLIGGIALFLVGLVIGNYTLRGAKRYVEMNFSLLRGR